MQRWHPSLPACTGLRLPLTTPRPARAPRSAAGAAAAAPPRPRSSDSDSSTGSGRSSRRSSNDVGAAYLAELEEREASRREMSRRNAGLAGTPAGAWGLGFFPSYII